MARFCAILGTDVGEDELCQMGGVVSYRHPAYTIGCLPDQRADVGSGPYFLRSGVTAWVAAGEVTLFNRTELLAGLHQQGIDLPSTAGDGEVLLHCYHQGGAAALAQVNGMFAVAIWNGEELVLARDALGARTLFYTRQAGCWAVSTSLRALRRWSRYPAAVNLSAVRAFLTFAYLPGEETLLEGIYQLAAGSLVRLTPAQGGATAPCPQPCSYWEPAEQPWREEHPVELFAARLRQRLETAVRMRLPAGQPVGVFLSGGVDSSLVTALAVRLHDRPVHTYAINFGSDLPNELAYSGLVAAHCGTRHRILTFDGQQIAAALPAALAALDCPVGDPLTVPNWLLAQAAAADGLPVILNGEGGDPCFGGPKNLPMLTFELHRCDADPQARARAYLYSYGKAYADLPRLLSPAVQSALVAAAPLERLVQPFLHAEQMPSLLNRLLYTNIRTKGANHILAKVERMTSAWGIEGRSPLFDPAVVDYAFAIPPHFKLFGMHEKWALKIAVDDLLPAAIVYRPKSGMMVPLQSWLTGPLHRLADDLLLGPQAQARGLFQRETIQAWANRRDMLWSRQGIVIWLLITLELWLRLFLDQQTPEEVATLQQRRLSWPRRAHDHMTMRLRNQTTT